MSRRLVLLTEIIAPYRIPVLNALSRQPGIDLHVIFLSESDPVLRQWTVYKNELQFSHQILPSWRYRFGERSILLNGGLTSALRNSAPDAILCGGYNYIASWQSLFWAKRNDVPLLAWVESNSNDKRQRRALVESLKTRFLRACAAVVVAGKSSAEYVKSFGVPEKTIFTAPNAVDSGLFAQRARAARENSGEQRAPLGLPARFFLFVGRLVREKGVFDLLEAYRDLAPEIREAIGLILVGDGPARPALERMAHGIAPGTIQFPGFAQRDQLAAYYGLAETFVFPTHTDPWGLVVNEAMACALPIIVTNVAGCVADLVDDDWNGRVVEVHNVRQLTSAMADLACDRALRAMMSARSYVRISQYSPEHCAAGMAHAVLACWNSYGD